MRGNVRCHLWFDVFSLWLFSFSFGFVYGALTGPVYGVRTGRLIPVNGRIRLTG